MHLTRLTFVLQTLILGRSDVVDAWSTVSSFLSPPRDFWLAVDRVYDSLLQSLLIESIIYAIACSSWAQTLCRRYFRILVSSLLSELILSKQNPAARHSWEVLPWTWSVVASSLLPDVSRSFVGLVYYLHLNGAIWFCSLSSYNSNRWYDSCIVMWWTVGLLIMNNLL